MHKQKDRFWGHVVEHGNGNWKCKYCPHVFVKGTSVSRIKLHLSGDEGHGVSICGQVPDDVRHEAHKAALSSSKRRKTRTTSITVPTSSREQSNEVSNRERGVEMMQAETQTAQREAERITPVREFGISSPTGLDWIDQSMWNTQNIQDENEVRDEGMVGPEFHSSSAKQDMGDGRAHEELIKMVNDYLMQPDGTDITYAHDKVRDEMVGTDFQSSEKEMMGRTEQEESREILNDHLRHSECLVETNGTGIADAHPHETRGLALLTGELVGRAFETKKDEIWSLLMNDNVLSIGVYGMGGVGKTTLMRHIYNQLLKQQNSFTHVYWVTVPQDFNIYKLQDLIAKTVKLDLSNEYEEVLRAAKLHAELNEKHKFVLILDDLWDDFDANEVGISIGMNGCKMIFTTRSRKICQQMCGYEKNIIKLGSLSVEEAWALFTIELGDYNNGLEPLAKAVARECAGLPLALKTMAKSMRRVGDISEWRNALEELKEAEKREEDMEPDVFQVLRYSYDYLKDLTTQECFLYCAFFPEDSVIQREELIEYLIVEGIIKGKKNRQAKHDKGHVILNKLEDACLLESCIDHYENRGVKMHKLIRDMAIQKLRGSSSIMVKAGAQLREMPDVDEWTESLEKVSLKKNYIKEISLGYSPRCPNLSTLLLTSNRELRLIADCFLEQLHGLKILDLSDTGIVKLPDSISEVVSLVALLLNKCEKLKYIPSLAKLTELQKLDISETRLEKLPEGMELLSNLSYLNLCGSWVKELPTAILDNLSHLGVLMLNKFASVSKISVTRKEVAGLKKLERLECYFEGFSDFRECMEHLRLCRYNFQIGQFNHILSVRLFSWFGYVGSKHSLQLGECCISTEQDFKAFPEDIEELMMWKCRLPGITLFDDSSLSLRCSMKLKYIYIEECYGIKSLVSLPCPSSNILKSLETLRLVCLENLHTVISRLPPLQSVYLFSCLKHFEITGCHGVKRLFPIDLLSTLRNLESIKVWLCNRMEEIQATEEEDDDDDHGDDEEEQRHKGEQNNSSSCNHFVKFIGLPKLKKLKLRHLPKLKSICSGVMICDSLQFIHIVDCPKLKRIPLSYPLPSLQTIQAYPKEWWELVEWDQLTDKNFLQPFLRFSWWD